MVGGVRVKGGLLEFGGFSFGYFRKWVREYVLRRF